MTEAGDSAESRRAVNRRRLARSLWYGLALYVLLIQSEGVVAQWATLSAVGRATAVLGLALILGIFAALHLAAGSFLRMELRPTRPVSTSEQRGESFPTPSTVGTGAWLLFATAFGVLSLLWSIELPPWLTSFPTVVVVTPQIQESLVMMFAAMVGSAITTILGFLDHASYRKDFDPAFVPWYLGRPIMGMLLGLVFFFLIKGGLWTVTPSGQEPMEELNVYGLAGIGSLVGLFSRPAIEKLRELFSNLFSTNRSTARSLIERLPAEVQSQVKPYWTTELGG